MADAKLVTYNETNGSIQFSTDSTNLVLASSGSQNFNTNADPDPSPTAINGNTRSCSLNITMSNFGLLVFRPVNTNIFMSSRYYTRLGGNSVQVKMTMFGTDRSQAFEWWVYDLPTTSSVGAGQVRFDIYAPDGSTRWQLYGKPFRCPAILSASIISQSLNSQSVTVPAGKKYGTVMGQPSGYVYYVDNERPNGSIIWVSRWAIDAMRTTASGIEIQSVLWNTKGASQNTQPPDKVYSPRNVLIADVTNH